MKTATKLKKHALILTVIMFLVLLPSSIAFGQTPPRFIASHLTHPAFSSYQIESDGSASIFFKTNNKDDVDWDAANLSEQEVSTGDYIHSGYFTKGLDSDSYIVHLKSMLPTGIEDDYSRNVKSDYFLSGDKWTDSLNDGTPYVISDIPWGLVSAGTIPAEIPSGWLNSKALVDTVVSENNTTRLFFETDDEALVDGNNKTLVTKSVPTGKTYFDGYVTTGNYTTDAFNVPYANQVPGDVGGNFTRQLMRDSVTGLPVTISGEQFMSDYNNKLPYSSRGYNWGLVYVANRENHLSGDVDPFNGGNGTASYISGWAVSAGFRDATTSALNGISTGSSRTFSGSISSYNAWVSNPAHRVPTTGNTGIIYMTITRNSSTNFTWNKYVVETVPVFNLEIYSYSEKHSEEMKTVWSWQEELAPVPQFSLENYSYSHVYDEVMETEWSWSLVVEPKVRGKKWPKCDKSETPTETVPGPDESTTPTETTPGPDESTTPTETTPGPDESTTPTETTPDPDPEPEPEPEPEPGDGTPAETDPEPDPEPDPDPEPEPEPEPNPEEPGNEIETPFETEPEQGTGGNAGNGQDGGTQPQGTTNTSKKTVVEVNVGTESAPNEVATLQEAKQPKAGPKTGDEASAFLYALMMAASLSIVLSIVYFERKHLFPSKRDA
ncbi:MAG: hypothetical protein FWC86_02615 [Coriobacteriia bacterium]|nr:hypothetical protein [Coriobacteriia bacterium]